MLPKLFFFILLHVSYTEWQCKNICLFPLVVAEMSAICFVQCKQTYFKVLWVGKCGKEQNILMQVIK